MAGGSQKPHGGQTDLILIQEQRRATEGFYVEKWDNEFCSLAGIKSGLLLEIQVVLSLPKWP